MASYEYSREIADLITDFLEEDDWRFSFDEDRGLFSFNLTLNGKLKKVNYYVDIKEDGYLVYAISSVGADTDDPEVMTAIAEFICRANYGMISGNFELDMDDGEIRYKVYVNCADQLPSTQIIKESIYVPASVFTQYSGGIMAVLFANADPKEAIKSCEKRR